MDMEKYENSFAIAPKKLTLTIYDQQSLFRSPASSSRQESTTEITAVVKETCNVHGLSAILASHFAANIQGCSAILSIQI